MLQKFIVPASRVSARVRRSPYAKPVVIFFILLAVCAILVTLFEVGINGREFSTILDGIWWVIITFSTTGYGDKVPVSVGGRIIAIMTILLGIGGVSLLSGGLASWLIDRNTRARRGLVDYGRQKDHFIICGWKDDMREILLHIIDNSAEITPDRIIIIADVNVEAFEQLQESEEMRGIKFVRGEYYAVPALKRAGAHLARKVLVLADTTGGESSTEIDSRTVLTVLTIKSIAHEVYVVAELLDKKFESYLRYVQCDEILFSRDVSQRILANTSVINGMSHIFYELLNQHSGHCTLITKPIPRQFINQAYREYRNYLQGDTDRDDRSILLGILENSGNPARLKIELLREAQKTSDVSRLVSNLREVKGLELNKPLFMPDDDYCIQHNSQAIILADTRVRSSGARNIRNG